MKRKTVIAVSILVGLISFVFLAMMLPAGAGASMGADGGIDWRQGGHETDWSMVGTNNYPVHDTLSQAGAIAWQGKPSTSGSVFVSYPETYGGGHTPLVFIQVIGPAADVVAVPAPLFAGMYIYWQTTGSEKTYLEFHWRAYGAKGNNSSVYLPIMEE